MSSIQVSAQKVIDACEKTLARIEKNKAQIQANEILKVSKWKIGWFSGKTYGYEKAFQYLENNPGFDFIDYKLANTVQKDEERVLSLLILARNGDPVTITSDDAWILL